MFYPRSFIEKQYSSPGLFEKIAEQLEQRGTDLNNLRQDDISGIDIFSVPGAVISEELASELFLKNTTILDVGCGIGGVSRMLAGRFHCQVTGIDLCQDFVTTAKQMSALTGLEKKTVFLLADALNLPFEDNTFDIVWSQQVQINIKDKALFFSEIKRVLNEQGTFVYYDIFRKLKTAPSFPLPWADNPSFSFLETTRYVDDLLRETGFVKLLSTDQTTKAHDYLRQLTENKKKPGRILSGLQLMTGSSFVKKTNNLLKGIQQDKIEFQSGIYRKKTPYDLNE